MTSDQKKRQLDAYARYSTMAFQMLVIILAGVFGGYKLDQWLHTAPLLVILLSILAVFIAIYSTTRDLLKKK